MCIAGSLLLHFVEDVGFVECSWVGDILDAGEEIADVFVEDFFNGTFSVVGNENTDNIVRFVPHVVIDFDEFRDVVFHTAVSVALELFLIEFLNFVEGFACEPAVWGEEIWVDVVVWLVEVIQVVYYSEFNSDAFVGISEFGVCVGEIVFAEFVCDEVVAVEVECVPWFCPVVLEYVGHCILSFRIVVLLIVLQ